MLYRVLYPFLRRLDAERAHELALAFLARAQASRPGLALLARLAGAVPNEPVRLFGLTFANRLGVAAGFDKDGRVVPALGRLGFGHIEVGTITPRPQAGNPRPRLFRLPAEQALINRLGFPNAGSEAAAKRLRRWAHWPGRPIIGASLGKQKETPLDEAAADYSAVMADLYPWVDYLALNISSPNTPGLRQLQGHIYLPPLLAALSAENSRLAAENGLRRRPLLLKLSPDLTSSELEGLLAAAEGAGLDGLIAVNTTLSRDGQGGRAAAEAGGLSGRPLAERSNAIIAAIKRQCGDRLPIIGVGGVFSAADYRRKLDAGASLVQLYTGLIYQGPGVARQILHR
jgi:dihydroorotate dehydrogenase